MAVSCADRVFKAEQNLNDMLKKVTTARYSTALDDRLAGLFGWALRRGAATCLLFEELLKGMF